MKRNVRVLMLILALCLSTAAISSFVYAGSASAVKGDKYAAQRNTAKDDKYRDSWGLKLPLNDDVTIVRLDGSGTGNAEYRAGSKTAVFTIKVK